VDSDDGMLVRRVLAGEVEAYAGLVSRYRDRLGRYAFRMLGTMEDAEDVVQETLVRAYRSLHRCDDPTRFGSWIFSILVNRCRTAGARTTRRGRLVVVDGDLLARASVPHSADRWAWREEIERALDKLDVDQREAFLLKHVEELSYDEMAAVTGAGVSALKMRVKRACERLRAHLQGVHSA
jgi:RNA polymerase sigma-70 factor (ECF subfamily)